MDWGKDQDFGDSGLEILPENLSPSHPGTWILSWHGQENAFLLDLICFSFLFIPLKHAALKIDSELGHGWGHGDTQTWWDTKREGDMGTHGLEWECGHSWGHGEHGHGWRCGGQ